MQKNKNIIAIIPARGGSKGVPKKNIKDLGGFPLIAYSIIAAKMSKIISRVIVSTDNEEIAEKAKIYGAEVPFLRPKEFATDKSGDPEVVHHIIKWLENNENYVPEYLVYLRPTTPLRDPVLLDKAIDSFVHNKEATCLRSGHEIKESPYKLFGLKNGFFVGLFPNDKRPEYFNLPRQLFPPVFQPDGYIDIWKKETIKKTGLIHGPKMLSFIVPDFGEVDREEDFKFIEFNLDKGNFEIYNYLKENYKQNS